MQIDECGRLFCGPFFQFTGKFQVRAIRSPAYRDESILAEPALEMFEPSPKRRRRLSYPDRSHKENQIIIIHFIWNLAYLRRPIEQHIEDNGAHGSSFGLGDPDVLRCKLRSQAGGQSPIVAGQRVRYDFHISIICPAMH